MTQSPPDIEVALRPRIGVRGVAACFALAGFAVALLNGLVSGGEASWVLGRGLIAMVACFAFGLMIGASGRAAVRERLDSEARGKNQDASAAQAPEAEEDSRDSSSPSS